MSFPTIPAFVHKGDWNSISDSHPAMKWMHEYTNEFDKGNFADLWPKYLDSNFTYSKSTGQKFAAGKASWDQVAQDYGVFKSYHHEPYLFVCWESGNGDYETLGDAWVYANLPGDDSAAKNFTDSKGQKWEIKVPGGFNFHYKKDGNSFKLASAATTGDSGPVVVELLKRGVMKPADLGL